MLIVGKIWLLKFDLMVSLYMELASCVLDQFMIQRSSHTELEHAQS